MNRHTHALMAANWKMHKTPSEALTWAQDFLNAYQQDDYSGSSHTLFCVPFTHLQALQSTFAGSAITVGAQDISQHEAGAFTGEISGAMLADSGVRFVVIGHSERRAYHQEDDALVAAKISQAHHSNITPILCVGESLEQREAGEAQSIVLEQIRAALASNTITNADDIVIAYEPIWAIGTGKTATAADAQEMCAAIRALLRELYGELAEEIYILYGGSMKPANALELLSQSDIDGGLIGGASLQVDTMQALLEQAKNTYNTST